MRSTHRIIFAALGLMFVFGTVMVTNVKAQGKLPEVLGRLDTFNKRVTTLRADVTMGKQNAQLGDDPEITVGTAIYAKRPGKDALVRIDWKKPEESLSVVDGTYKIYRPRLATLYTGSAKNASKDTKGNSALAFMNMTKDQLKANYSVELLGAATLSSGVQTFHLRMTPKAKTSYKTAELWVDVDGRPLQSKIIENNNDTTTVLLTNVKENETLRASDFQITPPNGTKVVKS
jgi:outer membrane lipoprotein-sorting protein